jgi:hypothetical protein
MLRSSNEPSILMLMTAAKSSMWQRVSHGVTIATNLVLGVFAYLAYISLKEVVQNQNTQKQLAVLEENISFLTSGSWELTKGIPSSDPAKKEEWSITCPSVGYNFVLPEDMIPRLSMVGLLREGQLMGFRRIGANIGAPEDLLDFTPFDMIDPFPLRGHTEYIDSYDWSSSPVPTGKPIPPPALPPGQKTGPQ